eukprot:5573282-Pleurochrysis_carterae.AAC.15
MPVWSLAPPAGSPFVTPLLVRFGLRPFRISRAGLARSPLPRSCGERMHSVQVGFKLASYVSSFGVAQYTACSFDVEGKAAHSCSERDSLTSSSVERLSLRRRTAFATFLDKTMSGS